MGLHEIYSYALLTKREVKMAGYWPSSFFFFFFFSKKRFISSHLDRISLVKRVYILLAWSIKDFIWQKDFAVIGIKNDLFISRAEKESQCVFSTIDPRGSLTFSLF